ncbi:MAG: hypothetical protein QN183_05020 [Armatimonadota bacterium]|nr:hypothetical protein [Armatimonadota bacterium]MDR7534114.1 hypothetical protein [Armatimonadota bacterium]MDR7535709.1 hypothetical protein [Armatimonadota bacterium]
MRALVLAGVLLTLAGGAGRPARAEPESSGGIGAGCLPHTIQIGYIVLPGNRCYTFYLVRLAEGALLGVGPAGRPRLQPGQVVAMDAPAALEVLVGLQYRVPMPAAAPLAPPRTVQAVTVRLLPAGRLQVRIAGPPAGTVELPVSYL